MSSPPESVRTKPAQAVRHLGRFQLLRLLGKSVRTMHWLVSDPASGQERVLVIPRKQPGDADALARWLEGARRATRIDHPGLLAAVEVGEQERWPFVAYERSGHTLLSERVGNRGMPAAELVPGIVPAIEGLAFAHEAGQPHHDLGLAMLAVGDDGAMRLIGLGVASGPEGGGSGMLAQRQAAERDVLAMGLVLHHALAGRPAFDEPDTMQAVQRLAPLGQESVRLPRVDGLAIAEPLRAIVNRSTDRQERQRYRNARTLARALSGWLRTSSEQGGGPLALLLDRMRVVGLLPSMPGGAARARRLATLERERTDDLAEIVLEDVGLSFELLRAVNAANQRVGGTGGNGPILTVRRAIAMLGLDGVRRAAQALKPWPGPLNEAQAADLAHQLQLAHKAGQVARWIRPAGYDAELVFLLAQLQRLGRLCVQYLYPDEAVQIRRLMQPGPPPRPGEPEEPGMSEQSAGFAVLGADLDAIGLAVARHWGFDEPVLHMLRRQPAGAPVHTADSDGEQLRLTASCANEVIDAQAEPPHRRPAALQHVAQRYARVLGVTLLEIQQCAMGIPPEEREPAPVAASATRPMPL